ncbi:copper resistance protein CopC [Nocardioides sp. MH1]|uniref:copper resistance CopC/CopD family protein n=1 Tax=Nocardioides sp. MH1 TaxID=3242490 RepID=UPI003521F8D2
MSNVRRALAAVILAGTLLVLATAPASAHASLVSTDPADGQVLQQAPEEVTLTFDEPVRVVDDGVEVYDATGEPLGVDAAARDEAVTADLPSDLADGSYVVVWRVISDDGHPVAGSLTFHIGAPSPSVRPPHEPSVTDDATMRSVVGSVQALSYVSLLVAGGLTIFLSWTARGVRLREEVRRRLLRTLRAAALVAVAVAAVGVPLSGAYQRGAGLGGLLDAASVDPDLVRHDLTVLLLQAVGLGLAAALSGRATPSLAGDIGAGLAVWSPALVGHTRAYRPESLLVLTDALHLSAGAVWLGGLVGLALALPSLASREREGALLLSRFSTVAAGLLAVLVGAGTLMAWRILGSWGALVDTTYGRLLLVKIGLALVVVAIAGWNRFVLLPRVDDGTHQARRRTTQRVRTTVLAEAVLLVGVLAVTGFLVEQPPRAEGSTAAPASSGRVARAAVDDLQVLAVLDDTDARRRGLTVQVQDAFGEPVDLRGRPVVSVSNGDVDLGAVPVEPTAAGTYRAVITFPAPGDWTVQVSLKVDEFDNPVTSLQVSVD